MTKVERWEIAPGLTISRIVTGLWQIADMERDDVLLDPVATAAALAPYVDSGLTTFDMADHYGSAERIVGVLLKESTATSDRVQALTKWVPPPGPSTRDETRAAVQRALDRLESKRIDLLQFHTWNYADPSYLDTLLYLQELKDEGLIRHIGLTNIDTAHLRVILHTGIEVVSNQVSFSLLDQRARVNGMTALCQEHSVTLLAFGTVAGGFLTERWLGEPEPDWQALETWSQMKYGRFIAETGGWDALQRLLRVVESIAHRQETSMANVACRYVLDQPSVGGVIVGARPGISDRREDNLRVFGFELSDEDHAELNAAVARLRAIPGDCGDEYRRAPYLTASGDLSHHIDELPAPYEATLAPNGRTRVLSGTVWEDHAGFSRAVVENDRILISGTTATHGTMSVGGSDAEAQAHFIIDKIEGALQSLGATLADVIRTRVYIHNAADWEAISRVHGQRFAEIMPANTLVQAGLIGSGYLVEIEAEAVLRAESDTRSATRAAGLVICRQSITRG